MGESLLLFAEIAKNWTLWWVNHYAFSAEIAKKFEDTSKSDGVVTKCGLLEYSETSS